jgi:hypothetical protein
MQHFIEIWRGIRMIVAICFAVVALVAGGYGLAMIAYERGYVHGYEEASHPEGWVFREEE